MFIQKYISDLLLINGRKFDFRTYMLIVRTDPMLVFAQYDLLRISYFNYDNKSSDFMVHMTNTQLVKDYLDEVNNLTKKEKDRIREQQMMTMEYCKSI